MSDNTVTVKVENIPTALQSEDKIYAKKGNITVNEFDEQTSEMFRALYNCIIRTADEKKELAERKILPELVTAYAELWKATRLS